MKRALRTLATVWVILLLASCDSCVSSGTTITGNPTLPITIARISNTGTVDISIPLGVFGETEDALKHSSIDIYVNDTLRTENLSPRNYYVDSTETVEIPLSSIADGDALGFIINNSVDEYTYLGTASADADTEATSIDANTNNEDTGNTYTISNFYGRWSRTQPCAGPDGAYSNAYTWLNVSTLIIGGTNCENLLYFDTNDEQPENTTSYSVSGDDLTITNSILGTTTLENVTFGGDPDNECINGYQFSGWEGDIELIFYASGPAGDVGCDNVVFGP